MIEEEVEKVKLIEVINPKTNRKEQYMMSLNIVGQGKYGKVYRATSMNDCNAVYAVKVIRLESEKIRKECLQELEIIRHLPKSKHLVQIYPQHLESENNFYIFEEYCDGGTLSDQKMGRKGKPYTEDEVFNIFYQVSRGFLDMRQAGIFHEDIKPQNILIKNGIYKLTDFGISQLSGKFEVSQIRKGTLLYMPPQKLKQSKYVPTSKSEIFSLGVTLYEIIFGHPPYLRKKPADYKEYLKLLQETNLKSINILREYFPDPSLALDKLIRTILRMIDLSEAKRLSEDELRDYVTNTLPFMNMVVEENPSGQGLAKMPKKKYEQIEHSKIMIRGSVGEEGILAKSTKQDPFFKAESFKIILKALREITGFLQQGIIYAKDCKIYQYKKQVFGVPHAEYLQLILAYLNNKFMQDCCSELNKFLFDCDQDFSEELKFDADLDFVSNEYLKIFTEISLPNKKEIILEMKEQNKTCKELFRIFTEIYEQIDCVRVNFKQDLLTIIFTREIIDVLTFLEDLENQTKSGNLASVIKMPIFEQVREKIKRFDEVEILKREKLLIEFRKLMDGDKCILEDDESNSDDFEILEEE